MQLPQNPCLTCPYKLGIIKTFVSPCPQCKLNNYSFYRKIKEQQGEFMNIGKKKKKRL